MARVNLGTGRIVVIVALIVAGLAILANGFSDGASVAAPGGGTVVSPSGSSERDAVLGRDADRRRRHRSPTPSSPGRLPSPSSTARRHRDWRLRAIRR